VRSDMLPGTDGQTIAILRRDVVALIAPAHSPVETVGHLAGKTIGLVQGPASDERILDQMLEYYQVPISSVHRVVLAPGEIGPALRQKRIAAVFAVGPTGPGPLTDVVTAVVKASKGAPEIIELEAVRPWRSARPCWRRPTSPPGPLGQRRPGRPRV
jgi:ABC-type nitrate/sulfonate/bicarbonate transport system substrate-binding protein